jgi:MFS family permease
MNTQKRTIAAIFTFSFIGLMTQFTGTTIAYIIHSYVARHNPDTIVQLMSLPSIFGIIASILVGPLALKINKKYLAIICALLTLIYMVAFALIGANGPLYLLFAATAFGGFAQGMSVTLMSSMIGEIVPPEKRAAYVAIGLAFMQSGLAITSLAGGTIAAGNGGANWPYAYWLGLIVIPVVAIFSIFMPKNPETASGGYPAHGESTHGGQSAGEPEQKERIPGRNIAIGILMIFSGICICGFLFYSSIYIVSEYQLGTTIEAGIANSICTVAAILVNLSYGIWSGIFKKFLGVVCFILIALGLFIMMTFTTNLAGIYIGALFVGCGYGLISPFAMGFIMRITPPRLMPVGISLYNVGMNIGFFAAIYTLNFLATLAGGGSYSLHNVLLVATIGMIACTVASVFVFQQPRKNEA